MLVGMLRSMSTYITEGDKVRLESLLYQYGWRGLLNRIIVMMKARQNRCPYNREQGCMTYTNKEDTNTTIENLSGGLF